MDYIPKTEEEWRIFDTEKSLCWLENYCCKQNTNGEKEWSMGEKLALEYQNIIKQGLGRFWLPSAIYEEKDMEKHKALVLERPITIEYRSYDSNVVLFSIVIEQSV